MPTYDYHCGKCGYRFEEFQSMTSDPLKICPECKEEGLRRLIGTGAGLIFKGSGFYITDYKNNGNGKAHSESAKKEKSSSPAKESAGESSSKSKPSDSKSEAAA